MSDTHSALPEPVERPLAWQAAMVGLGLLWSAAATAALYVAFDGAFHILTPIAGLCAGMTLFCALVGFKPGRFRRIGTDHEVTLWTAFTPVQRLGAAALAFAAGIGGPLLTLAA
ncbi:MAG: hypothetical protein R3B40_19540 [Polyangiales bacterium]